MGKDFNIFYQGKYLQTNNFGQNEIVDALLVKKFAEKNNLCGGLKASELDVCNSDNLGDIVDNNEELNPDFNVVLINKSTQKKTHAKKTLSDQKAVELQSSNGFWMYSDENMSAIGMEKEDFNQIYEKFEKEFTDLDTVKEDIKRNIVMTAVFLVYLKLNFASKLNEMKLIMKKSENALNKYFDYEEDRVYEFIGHKIRK